MPKGLQGFQKGSLNPKFGKVLLEEEKEKLRLITKERVKNGSWVNQFGGYKGDKVGYRALHSWVARSLGKPDTCEHCGSFGLTGRKIGWANKSNQYKRNLSDWLRLCTPCHRKYDSNYKNAKLNGST